MRQQWLDEVARASVDEAVSRRGILGKLAVGIAGAGLGALAGAGRAGAAPAVKCPPGLENCGGVCRVTSIDPDNCGACGNACPAGQVCRGGVCVGVGPSLVSCDGVYVDVSTNASHCGACGNACLPGAPCVAGVCGCTPGFTRCGNDCVDLQSDPQHCGGCETACPGGQPVCVAGTCVECASPADCGQDTECLQHACTDNACVFILTPQGTSCAGGGGVCNGEGSCVCAEEGLTYCSGVCVDTQSDPQYCGDCDTACIPGQICVAGTCQYCQTPADCGQDTACLQYVCGGDNLCAVIYSPPGTACPGGVCDGNGTCVADACNDGVKNGNETDIDCGGQDCLPCANGKTCLAHLDCASLHCLSGVCKGAGGDSCLTDGECASNVCSSGQCLGTTGDSCLTNGQCASGVCLSGVCQ